MRPILIGLAVASASLGLTGVAGCAGSDSGGSSTGDRTVQVTFKGDTVTPNGDRVKAGVGTTVTLKIHADRAGEIHVHSTPEQEIAYPAGDSTEKITIDKPGIVDVESHTLDKTILQLQVQ